jgi:hemerythrin-like domain-containing protein
MNNIFDQLKKEHEQVKSVMEQIQQTGIKSVQKRQTLFQKLQTQLLPHEKAEEKVFYPLLLKENDFKEDAMEALEEHHFSEVAIKELNKLPASDEHWLAKFVVFSEMVKHHIQEEESKIFDDAHMIFQDGQSEMVSSQFVTQEKQLRQKIAAKH